MATIIFHEGLGAASSVNSTFDWANLMLFGFGNTARLVDPDNNEIVLTGTGMMYSPASPSWGIATGIINTLTVQNAAGTPLFQVTGAAADAAWLYSWIIAGNDLNSDVNGGPGRLWGTNDTVIGSDDSDTIILNDGDATVFLGNGADFFQSTGGHDTVTGGMGRDEFVQPARSGSLTITDFSDAGPRSQQDVLRMSRWEHRNMDREQDGADTVLTIHYRRHPGQDATITLQDYDLANLGYNDFAFGF